MHAGIGPDGKRLYPAFPYPYFTKMTHDDVLAIRAYLNTLPAVSRRRPDPDLTWPLQHRVFMRGWDWLFFKEGTFAPDPQKSCRVEPRRLPRRRRRPLRRLPHAQERARRRQNRRGAARQCDPELVRAEIGQRFARRSRRMERRRDRRVSQDRPQHPQRRDRPDGGSRRQFDLEARQTPTCTPSPSTSRTSSVNRRKHRQSRSRRSMDAGKAIFADACSACHQADGKGVARMFPPLVHNANVQSADATSVIRVILEGARTVPTDARPTPSSMPSFGWKLDRRRNRGGRDLRAQFLGQCGSGGGRGPGQVVAQRLAREDAMIALNGRRELRAASAVLASRALDFMPRVPGLGPSQRRYAGAGRCRPAAGRACCRWRSS